MTGNKNLIWNLRTVVYKTLIIFLCCFCLKFFYLPYKVFASTEHQKENLSLLYKRHPRLYLTRKKIQFIKSRLTTYPYLKFWRYVKKRAKIYAKEKPPVTVDKYDDNTIRGLGNRLPYMAMAYLLTNNKLYLKGVKKWMKALCSYPNWASNKDLGAAHILFGMSICYDWLYNRFTPKERALYRKKMAKHANILYNLLVNKKIWWAKAYLQNHNYTNVMSIAIAGIALYGEVKEAKTWIVAARENFKHVLYWLSPDGATHEGVNYWGYGIESLLKYFMAMAPIYGLDDVKNSPFFQKTAYYRLHMSLPDFKDNVNYADSPCFEYHGPGFILRCLASIFNNGYAQWLAEKIETARGKKAMYSWLDLIWYDEKVKPIPPDDLPTYAYFENLGIFVNRTSWAPNAIWVFFKAGPPLGKFAYLKNLYKGAGHVHPDEGNFLLWAYGKWLIVDEGYTYLKSTVNHNVFLFNGYGQIGEGHKWFGDGDAHRYKACAQIEYTDFKSKYKYIVADLTKIYPPEAKLKRWVRTWIFLPDSYLIIRDDIKMKNLGCAESFLHLGCGYVKKTNYGFRYQDYNIGFDLYEVYDKPDKESIEPTFFIGKRKETNNSKFTLHFIYKRRSNICSILVFKVFRGKKKEKVTFLKRNNNYIEFLDNISLIKINFSKKEVIVK